MNFLKHLFNRNTKRESNISRTLRVVLENDNPSTRRDLYSALTRQRLILPLSKEPGDLRRDASGRLLETTDVEFISFKDRNGRKFMAVFTNPEALQRFTASVPTWIAVDGPSLCRLALQSGQSALQINPGNSNFVELNREEIRLLADGEAVVR